MVVQWLSLHLPMQGVRVQCLGAKLRSHMPQGQKTKQKQCCQKFNKDFKKWSLSKKKKKS